MHLKPLTKMSFNEHLRTTVRGIFALFIFLFFASCTGPQETKVSSGFLGGIYLSADTTGVSLGSAATSASSTIIFNGGTISCTVTLKDQNGKRFVSPDPVTVEFFIEGGTSAGTFSTVTDNQDGTYSSTFTATTAGTASNIKARINGQSIAIVNASQIIVTASTVTGFSDGSTTTSSTSAPTFSWSATTGVSSIGQSGYQLAIGTTAGGTDVMSWTNVGNVLSYTLTGLTLSNGTAYYGSIRAVDSAGNSSSITQGDGFSVITVSPTLNLDFMTGILPIEIQFSRLSGANIVAGTYFNSAGTLVSAPQNLLTYTQDFTNAAWTKTNSSISTNVTAAPDSSTTASKLIEDGTNNLHTVAQNFNAASGNTYCISAYMKSAERTKFYIQFNNAAGFNTQTAYFDLSAGTVFQTSNSPTASGITSLSNGWYRGYVCAAATSTAAATGYIAIINSSTSPWNYTGDGTSGAYIWGAQVESGSTPTSYIYATSTLAYGPRFDYDPSTLSLKGLLIEASSTNSIKSSGDLSNTSYWTQNNVNVTANSTLAPDGTTTAATIDDNYTAGNATLNSSTATATNSQVWTGSLFIKKDTNQTRFPSIQVSFTGGTPVSGNAQFNTQTGAVSCTTGTCTVQDVGNYWRLSLAVTNNSTGNNVVSLVILPAAGSTIGSLLQSATGSIIAWGAQLEQRNTPSSYIPTTTLAQSRAVDRAKVLTSSGSWFNSSAGTIYGKAVMANYGGNQFVFDIDDGTANNRIGCYVDSVGVQHTEILTSSSAVFTPFYTAISSNYAGKVAMAYSNNDFASSANGETVQTSSSGSVPTVTQLQIGTYSGGGSFLANGWIQNIKYYNSRLTNAQIKNLSEQ